MKQWFVVAAALAAAVFLWGTPGFAQAPSGSVEWQQGFPMRAGGQVLLLWVPWPGAERYTVTRRDTATQEVKTWEVRGGQHVDAEAAADRTYVYEVRAVLAGGAPGPVSEARRVEGFKPLTAPRWSGTYQDQKGVHLVWEAVPGAAFYNVYRGPAGAAPALVASVQDTKHVDPSLREGTVVYRVRAVGLQSQESPDSEPLTVTRAVAAAAAAPAAEAERRYVEVAAALRETPLYRLREPTDLAFSRNTLFVTDLGSRSVLALGRDGELLFRFGTAPPGYEADRGVPWGIPWGIGVSADGETIALTFLRSPAVRTFSRRGALVLDVVLPRPKGFEERPEIPQPMDVAVDAGGNLWVSDHTFGQVVRLGPNGRETGRVGRPRLADDAGPFGTPTFVAFHPGSGETFVVDSLLGEVFGLDATPAVARRWRRAREAQGNLNLPKGISLTGPGNLLVVDGLRSSLQVFTAAGELVAVYYSRGKEFLDLRGLVAADSDPATGDVYALSKVDSTVYRLRVVR